MTIPRKETTEAKPDLLGLKIAITRDERAAAPYKKQVEELGGKLICLPLVHAKPLVNRKSLRELAKMVESSSIDYLIFMSTTAAEVFAGSMAQDREIAKTRIIAIGPMTKARLEALGFAVKHMPPSYSSEGLIAMLRDFGVQGKTIGLVRAKGASSYLRRNLKSLGAKVIEVGAYEVSEALDEPAYENFRHSLLEGEVDVILFTSSFSVKAFANRLLSQAGEKLSRLLRERVLIEAIGPSTARELESNGIPSSLVSPVHTVNGMIGALADYVAKKTRNVQRVRSERSSRD